MTHAAPRATPRLATALALLLLGSGSASATAASAEEPCPDPHPVHDELAAGREIYQRCAACHSIETDRTGPRHCGLFGRRAGSVEGFNYSPAMQRSGIVWSRATLDHFLENPMAAVPGTLMGYAGIPDPEERAELLRYLQAATAPERCAAGEPK